MHAIAIVPWLSVFVVIFLAELPDKTSLTALVLATRQPPARVWLGSAVAFAAQTVLSVAAGTLIALVPAAVVRVVSGVAFLAFAVLMWRRVDEPEVAAARSAAAVTGIGAVAQAAVLVFLAEFGDLTQLATASLEAHLRRPLFVGLAAWLGLVAAAAVAVVAGNRLGAIVPGRRLQQIAALVFAAVGAAVLLGVHPAGL